MDERENAKVADQEIIIIKKKIGTTGNNEEDYYEIRPFNKEKD